MFQFRYIGKFDCIITKKEYELYIKNMYYNMKKIFNIKYSPKKIKIIMEMNPKKSQGWGGTREIYSGDINSDIYEMKLQLFGYPKKLQTFNILAKFFGHIITHEMFHFFIPFIINYDLWSEGVTDFMAAWYNNNISNHLSSMVREYKQITDPDYKLHKYSYLAGYKKMVKLYKEDESVINIMKKIIKDCNKNKSDKKKTYIKSDIIKYNPKFKVFFYKKYKHENVLK